MIDLETDLSENMHVLDFKELTLSADKNHITTAVDISSKIDSDFSDDSS